MCFQGGVITMVKVNTRRRADDIVFPGLALLLFSYVLIGFWDSYIGAGFFLASLPSLMVHVHAVFFLCWIILLLVQNAMVAAGNVQLHRQLGAVMGGLALAVFFTGLSTVVLSLRRSAPGISSSAFAGDIAQLIAFAFLICRGFILRKDALAHKRLMTLATAAIMGPALIRWPFDFIQSGPPIGLVFFYLLPPLIIIAYDVIELRSIHRSTLFGLFLMVVAILSFSVLPAFSAWEVFTHWVRTA